MFHEAATYKSTKDDTYIGSKKTQNSNSNSPTNCVCVVKLTNSYLVVILVRLQTFGSIVIMLEYENSQYRILLDFHV